MTAEHLLSAYIDTNIVLLIVAAVWFGSKRLIARSPLKSAYLTQLHLLYGLLAMVVLSPAIVYVVETSQQLGYFEAHSGRLSFSDFLVAQYLHGNIAMAPSSFERLLMMRSELTHDIVSLGSWIGNVVLGGLLFGFLTIVIRNARDTWMLMGMIRRSYVLRRVGKIDVRFTHETCVPFSTRGLFRHYIVLPTGLLTQNNDVRIAVSHEIQHVRQRDLTWEIALELLRPFFFWNPAFAFCKRDVERIRELACDQQVLSRNTHSIRAYCECLLRVCQTSLLGDRSNQIITPSVPFVQVDRRANASHSEGFLRHRIVSVLDGGSTTPHRNWAAMTMLSVFAMVILMAVALRPVNDWSHDRLMLSTIVNLERLNARDTEQP
ncbi:MAG: M56 family metallopeptidase [Sulfitobacter sp.]